MLTIRPIWDIGISYSNVEGITYATIGAGDIRVRDYENYNFDALNRDVDNVQVTTSETYFAIEIPAINLNRWKQQVRDSVLLLKAVTTQVPQKYKDQGDQAVDLYRDAVLSGLSGAELSAYLTSPTFRKQLQMRKNYINALEIEDSDKRIQALYNAILFGETMYFDQNGQARVNVDCGTAGACSVLAEELGPDVGDIDSQKLIDLVYADVDNILDMDDKALAALVFQCSIELARDGKYGALVELYRDDNFKAPFPNEDGSDPFTDGAKAFGYGDPLMMEISVRMFEALDSGSVGELQALQDHLKVKYDEAKLEVFSSEIAGLQSYYSYLDQRIFDAISFAQNADNDMGTAQAIIILFESNDTFKKFELFGPMLFASGSTLGLSKIVTAASRVGMNRVSGLDVSKGFKSFSAFKRTHGEAGSGQAWHHIVEQRGVIKFGAKSINNPTNMIKLPHGSGTIHNQISGFYSSKTFFSEGKTVRQWLSGKSYQEQFDFGVQTIKDFGGTQYLPSHLR